MAKLRIENRFGVAPNELLNDPDISFKAKGLYTFMQSKPDNWDFAVARIMKQTKDGRDGVSSGLKELEQAGYLKRNKFQDKNGQWDVEYVLYSHRNGFTVTANPKTEKPTTENPSIKEKRSSKKEVVKSNKDIYKDVQCDFDVFWNLYPRKTAKAKAKEAFTKASKKSNFDFNVIIASVQKHIRYSKQWQDKQYVPHAATWLNGERWEDEVVEATTGAYQNQKQSDSTMDKIKSRVVKAG